ncbi:MAG: phenylalanine--tRNA ligase subunit alpha, partial [Blautia sp.]|nr:phenylalanine--tRNA ligase subunit alpha [Blautia sp.]
MKDKLQELADRARKLIEQAEGPDRLNEARIAFLGKKGELTAILKSMKDVAPEERPMVG